MPHYARPYARDLIRPWYLLRRTLVYKPKDFNRNWLPRFSTLWDKNGWIRAKTAGNLNLGVSRNRFCDFLADPDSRSFSRFGAIIMQFAVSKRPVLRTVLSTYDALAINRSK